MHFFLLSMIVRHVIKQTLHLKVFLMDALILRHLGFIFLLKHIQLLLDLLQFLR